MFYDFKCSECGHVFEKEKSIRESSNERCVACGKEAVRVISGGAGFLSKTSSSTPVCGSAGCGADPSTCAMANRCCAHH
ncbi:MAG: hypothetical protein A2324_22140 [Candidatus Raymondbacteria bacterium RIFOXYB2_FULL_49_35]|nr:MAG: hypothetical protein A2453_00795 [Candidatus Raymondbacteria bacterium RIFOXYC2_FULL_50_21]OGP45350.1 MAG: hypothetical protein A2324_22140 [Candidatus Raymondbacteria bacterium RIFOXYB2_FULL_49_35]